MIKSIFIKTSALRMNMKKLLTILTLFLLFSMQTALAECFDSKGVPLTTPTSDFTFSPSDPIVIHNKTGLMWQRCPVGYDLTGGICKADNQFSQTFKWEKALTLANRENFAGLSGWRLPNVKELVSIAEDGCLPNINLDVFPFDLILGNGVNNDNVRFWSSSPSVTSANDDARAYSVAFHSFPSPGASLVTNFRSVLLVRDTEANFADIMAPAFEHPRCQNCHAVQGTNFMSGGDANGVGLPTGHPAVNAATDAMREEGEGCRACHVSNEILPNADLDIHWHAAPLSNDLRGLSIAELCERAKEVPASAPSGAHQHLTEDPLILWAFQPKRPLAFGGGSFEAAPPYSIEAWRDAIDVWRDANLPCPSD